MKITFNSRNYDTNLLKKQLKTAMRLVDWYKMAFFNAVGAILIHVGIDIYTVLTLSAHDVARKYQLKILLTNLGLLACGFFGICGVIYLINICTKERK